jgi:hypothetical protein
MLSPETNSTQPSTARADAARALASKGGSAAAPPAFVEAQGSTGYDSGPANLTGEAGIDRMLRLEHALKLYGSPF